MIASSSPRPGASGVSGPAGWRRQGADSLRLEWVGPLCSRLLDDYLVSQPLPIADSSIAGQIALIEFGAALSDAGIDRFVTGLQEFVKTAGADPARAPHRHLIPVVYDGVDLAEVARQLGVGGGEVIALHSAPDYCVEAIGFAPGFPYLSGLDPRLRLPRRKVPRERVPKGSVAVAARYSGIYPFATPGGWHLLGTTDAVLFDERESDPCLMRVGDFVKFQPLGQS